MAGKEEEETTLSFSDILGEIMSNKDYLTGAEPEGSDWDFSDWPGYDFRQFGGWVLGEKFFSIPTIDNKLLAIRIVQTDPKQFSVKTPDGGISVGFVLTPVNARGFPTILIGKDLGGGEKVIRNSRQPAGWHRIPQPLRDLAKEVGSIEKSSLTQSSETVEWSAFLKDILVAKRVFPDHYKPTDFMVRDRLELGPDEEYSEEDIRLAEMQIVEDELLTIAYADYVLA
ncbi:hypothetical protein A2985_03675 [Candidatus Woesebacteria bacterium RIFCSPLOWO2_01_FULL_43_11]|uniref:Uncharacterized protein n=1 Tax=Candidatus Woesebacteria bacterium RBG_16_42_24 TaxID=1802485 RepID=A0A1F7XKP9_9BACT|nr:MAG: hypothetical protein A2V97_01885 [Candidatus Woesebacteria bacterium RBG_16_42_24]OGM66400.1 MAG: hypothetical protein A2985_03675 [Candidatus Woesebacteria bacterium RIFCSPLOWO2_01_FULL_43_11]